jgi:hypothetical protein
MLAQRFSRINTAPIRYAITDPAHMHALQNYLRIQSVLRGLHGIPGHAQNGGIEGGEGLQPGTMGGSLLHGLIHEDDPASFMALLDHMHDVGTQRNPWTHNDPWGQVPLDQGLFTHLTDMQPHFGAAEEHPELSRLLRMYSGTTLNHPDVQRATRAGIGMSRGSFGGLLDNSPSAHISRLLAHLHARQDPREDEIHDIRGSGTNYRPLALANLGAALARPFPSHAAGRDNTLGLTYNDTAAPGRAVEAIRHVLGHHSIPAMYDVQRRQG